MHPSSQSEAASAPGAKPQSPPRGNTRSHLLCKTTSPQTLLHMSPAAPPDAQSARCLHTEKQPNSTHTHTPPQHQHPHLHLLQWPTWRIEMKWIEQRENQQLQPTTCKALHITSPQMRIQVAVGHDSAGRLVATATWEVCATHTPCNFDQLHQHAPAAEDLASTIREQRTVCCTETATSPHVCLHRRGVCAPHAGAVVMAHA